MGRNINQGDGVKSFISLIIKILIIAAIIYGAYYLINKNDIVNKVKSSSEKTLEQFTGLAFDDISNVTVDTKNSVPVEEFIAKYKDKKYKVENDMKKLSEDGNEIYYVYNENGNYEYKLFDLGDGYIKIVKDAATLYKEVN